MPDETTHTLDAVPVEEPQPDPATRPVTATKRQPAVKKNNKQKKPTVTNAQLQKQVETLQKELKDAKNIISQYQTELDAVQKKYSDMLVTHQTQVRYVQQTIEHARASILLNCK